MPLILTASSEVSSVSLLATTITAAAPSPTVALPCCDIQGHPVVWRAIRPQRAMQLPRPCADRVHDAPAGLRRLMSCDTATFRYNVYAYRDIGGVAWCGPGAPRWGFPGELAIGARAPRARLSSAYDPGDGKPPLPLPSCPAAIYSSSERVPSSWPYPQPSNPHSRRIQHVRRRHLLCCAYVSPPARARIHTYVISLRGRGQVHIHRCMISPHSTAIPRLTHGVQTPERPGQHAGGSAKRNI